MIPTGPARPLDPRPKMGVLYENPIDGEIGYYGEWGVWIPVKQEAGMIKQKADMYEDYDDFDDIDLETALRAARKQPPRKPLEGGIAVPIPDEQPLEPILEERVV